MNIYWQVKMGNGSIVKSGPKIKLPQENVKEIHLVVEDKVKVSCEVKGKPFYFCRTIASISFDDTTFAQEYHLGYDDLELIYFPTTDEVRACCGERKTL